MSITKCPGHIRILKLNFSATVLTLGLKAKIRKFKTLLSESFGGNCARAPRLTAVWVEYACLLYQYSNMAPGLSGQTSVFGGVFFWELRDKT